MIRYCVLVLLLLPEYVWSLSFNGEVGIQDSLIAQSDTTEYFALYVPKGPQKPKKAILYFEPVGRAALPLALYRELADQYGYTLICPYGSRNGDFQPTLNAADAMMNELALMGYQSDHIYTSGFSGGARAAAAIQQVYGLAGVIAVAGGWPPSKEYLPIEGDSLSYVAIVGDKDMNMLEHGRYQEYLSDLSITNAIVYYPARHQWPPVSVYRQGLAWLQRSIGGYSSLTDYADSLLSVNPYLGYLQWQQWSLYPTDNFPIGQFKDKMEILETSETIKQLVADHQIAQKKQLELRQAYEDALDQLRADLFKGVPSEYGLPWWKTEIRKLHKWSGTQDPATALMADRIIDGLRGAFHIMITEANDYSRFEIAATLNQIMLLMYPDSVVYHFNQAVYLALQGHYKKAEKWLSTAQELDTELLNRLRSNPLYDGLKSQKEYEFLF